jgi:predicted Zn-dependent peptidase
MKFKKKTLKNGLRIITVPVKGNPSVTVMVMAAAGSIYESKDENGISHFLEHMCFKGTPTRKSALDISLEIEKLGAENNAFTYNEFTGYYAKGEKRHFKKLLDIVSDLYLNPTIPETELEKERGVILQEISMYEDLPKQKVQEVFDNLMYGDTPAGRTILGPAENIKRFKREDFLNYKKKHYVASGTLVAVAGDISPKEVESLVEKHFKDISTSKKHGKEKIKSNQKSPAILIHHKKTDQTHMVLGFRGLSAKDKDSVILDVMAGILGKGMSSRLFQKLREEMGACYYVRAYNNAYTDHGEFTIATGVEKKRVNEVLQVLLDEYNKLKNEEVSKEELQKTKDYLIGNLYMGLETTDALASFFVMEEIVQGSAKNVKEIEDKIRSVTAKDIKRLANKIFVNHTLNLAIVGDIKDTQILKKSLHL